MDIKVLKNVLHTFLKAQKGTSGKGEMLEENAGGC
jgi:hypothetical protein